MTSARAQALWDSLTDAEECREPDTMEGWLLHAVRMSLARVAASMDLLAQPVHRPAWTGRGEEA